VNPGEILAAAIHEAVQSCPVVEFRFREDWHQYDPTTKLSRWRHHRAPNWSPWRRDPHLFRVVGNSAIRCHLVPRAEADDWRGCPEYAPP